MLDLDIQCRHFRLDLEKALNEPLTLKFRLDDIYCENQKQLKSHFLHFPFNYKMSQLLKIDVKNMHCEVNIISKYLTFVKTIEQNVANLKIHFKNGEFLAITTTDWKGFMWLLSTNKDYLYLYCSLSMQSTYIVYTECPSKHENLNSTNVKYTLSKPFISYKISFTTVLILGVNIIFGRL